MRPWHTNLQAVAVFISYVIVTTLLKMANVCPICKRGNKGLAKNYCRPAALKSHLIWIFDKFIRDKIMENIETNNLYSENQHSCRNSKICLSKLLPHYNWLLENLAVKKMWMLCF